MKYEVSNDFLKENSAFPEKGLLMSGALDRLNFQTSSIPEQVRDAVKEAILDGRLCPGERLPSEEQMARTFHVSKTVLREALGHLVAEGWIEKRRGATGGSFVAEGNPRRIQRSVEDCYHLGGLEIEEVFEFRRTIEPLALEMACARRTDADLKVLEKNLAECRAALDQKRVDRYRQVEFHRLLAEACHNRLIASSMSAAVTISREFTSRLPFSYEEGMEDFQYNVRFFECLRERRARDGKKLMTQHFERSRELVDRYRSISSDDRARPSPGAQGKPKT
jgi:GntR family transcriptional regulator, transcriptional repressor for pyruvate dehydrogenase complex